MDPGCFPPYRQAMNSSPCCLLVGEDPNVLSFLHYHFARLCPNFCIVELGNGEEAVAHCRRNRVELIIAHAGQRGSRHQEFVGTIRRLDRHIPILVIGEGGTDRPSPRREPTRYLRKRTWSLELGPMLEKLGIFTNLSLYGVQVA